MLARNLSAAPASLLWSKSDQLKIYIRFYHTGLSREKSMKVIFYVAATCGNIDFHFIANLEQQFVITRSLTTLFWSLYLLHMERERWWSSGVRLEICYLHTAPPVKVLNQASPQHLSANERCFRFTFTSPRDCKTLSTGLLWNVCVCSFSICFQSVFLFCLMILTLKTVQLNILSLSLIFRCLKIILVLKSQIALYICLNKWSVSIDAWVSDRSTRE